jgi:Phasin protein
MASAGKSSGATPIGRRGPKTGSSVAVRTIPAVSGAPELNFEPSVAIDACRRALAPALRAQLEALTAIERFGRFQYAVAGDYLAWSTAQARASLVFGTPAEHVASQTTLAAEFGEKLQGRVREFVDLASETRASFSNCWVK